MSGVLIVDDEPSIVLALKDELIFEGFEVESASDGPSAIETARAFKPDVMLLDLMLPGLNGFEVCRQVRAETPNVWIIILSVRSHEVDRIRGLNDGADDFVSKPFSLREVVARVKAAMRRLNVTGSKKRVRAFGSIEMDLLGRRVLMGGREIPLTHKEFDMLALLIERAGEVIKRDEFLDLIWGEEVYVTHRVIDTHIASLRRKIEDDPDNPRLIHSVRGIGYKLGQNLSES